MPGSWSAKTETYTCDQRRKSQDRGKRPSSWLQHTDMQDGHSLNQSELAVRHFPNQLAFRRTRVIVAFRAFVELVSDYSERVFGFEFVQFSCHDPVVDF